jgi:aminoglycoside 6'-N-acetyltransferase I
LKSRYGLEIRAATLAEAPGLAELLAGCGHNVEPRALADRLDAMRDAAGAVLVALEWGPPSGVVVLHWHHSLLSNAKVAQISVLLVGVDERRRGIGRLLVKAASQAARLAGCDTLEILTQPGQDELTAFCEATGFTDAGVCKTRALRKK